MLPLHVFKNRNFSLASGMSFLLGVAMLGALTFLPLYQQTVQHASPTGSGLMLIPLMLGSTVTTLIAGQVTSRTGRYKILPIIGGAVMTVGIYLLTHLGVHTTPAHLGAVLRRPGRRHGLPDADHLADRAEQRAAADMGVASSSRAFFQQIGGSIGVSLFGVIFVQRLTGAMAAQLPGVHLQRGSRQPGPGDHQQPAGRRQAARRSTPSATAWTGVFWWTIPAAVAGVHAGLVRQGDPAARPDRAAPAPAAGGSAGAARGARAWAYQRG